MGDRKNNEYDSQRKQKWTACDFCRVKKSSKFKEEYKTVTTTDEGGFQGPTCYLTVRNTNIIPSPDKDMQCPLASESVPKPSAGKKKASKCGMTPAELKEEQDRAYQEMLKESAKEDKQNRKIALQRLKKEDSEVEQSSGPAWYQELSYKQMMYIEMLQESLYADLLENTLTRTQSVLAGLGIFLRPSNKDVSQAAKKCFLSPMLFLLYLYKEIGTTPLKRTERYFCVNDRLILSAIAYLALPRTLMDLHISLPVLPPEDIKEYPAVQRRKKKTYSSPYLEPQPFSKHCYQEEEKMKLKKRKSYLRKIKERKRRECKVPPESVYKPTPTNNMKNEYAQSVRYSNETDKCDQITKEPERKTSPMIPYKSAMRKGNVTKAKQKMDTSNNIKNNKNDDKDVFAEEIETKIKSPNRLSFNMNIIKEEQCSELYESNLTNEDSKNEDDELINNEHQNESNSKELSSQTKLTDSSLNRDQSDTSEVKNTDDDGTMIYFEPRNYDHVSTPEISVRIIQHTNKEIYDSFSLPSLQVSENKEEDQELTTTRKTYPRPLFFPPETKSSEPDWCTCRRNRTLHPIFLDKTCECLLPEKFEVKSPEPELEPVDEESSTTMLLSQECMQLPFPIPTRPTIKAMLAGYWEQTFHPSHVPSVLTPQHGVLKPGGKNIFKILVKKVLIDMAINGNPLACFPNVHQLPQIKQLIRERMNFRLTEKLKEQLMLRSYDQWNKQIGRSVKVKLPVLKTPPTMTWKYIYKFKKKTKDHSYDYRRKVRQALVDDARAFWDTMSMDYFNNPRFRSVFFAYLPSKEEDVLSANV